MKVHFVKLRDLYGELTDLANELIENGAEPRIRDLRGQGQKRTREMHQAALFARCIQGAWAIDFDTMYVGSPESEDSPVDAILLWKCAEGTKRLDIQLKEVPPTDISSAVTHEEVLTNALKKLRGNRDVVLAIFSNRDGDAKTIAVPEHDLAGVCFFGAVHISPRILYVIGEINGTHIQATVPLKVD